MTGEFTLALAFATGLFGSFHCIGMCSGINGSFTLGFGRDKLFPVLTYHLTRILMYVLFGVAGALLGRVVVQTGIIGKTQGILMILAGVIVVLLGLNLLGLLRRPRPADPTPRPVSFSLGKTKRSINPVLAGLLNGLMPCGLVFSVAVKAAAC